MNIPPINRFTKGKLILEHYIQKNYPEFWKYILTKYPTGRFQEKLYLYINGLDSPPTCPVCGDDVVFISFGQGFKTYCSPKCSNSSQFKKEKAAQTCLKKYGGRGPLSSKDVRDKVDKTFMQKYGVRRTLQTPEGRKKMEETCIKKYGVRNPLQSEDVKNKWRQTCVERYGVDNPTKNPQIVEARDENLIEKYNGQIPWLLSKDRIKGFTKQATKEKYGEFIDYNDDGTWICQCPHPDCNKCIEKTYIIDRVTHLYRLRYNVEPCTKLNPIGGLGRPSNQEQIIRGWLDEWNIPYTFNDRTILRPMELDIYIPSKQMAIECNGCYWHCDREKPKNYHLKKFQDCQKQGIQLIQIWEDWMIRKPEVVKSFLQAKLGICNQTFPARKCLVKEIDYQTSTNFLEANHIQGKCQSNVRLGLFYHDTLVAVMCFNKRSGVSGSRVIKESEVELIRFCNLRNTRVIGGAGKLLDYYIKYYHPSLVTSFSSNDISNGQLYKSLGFTSDDNSSESYWYIEPHTFQRYHRSIFSRAGISDKWPEYKMDDKSWTEKSVMDSKGYMRIYDAGTTCWKLNCESK